MSEPQDSNSKLKTPAVLLILDGWGVAPDSPGNAITRAATPNFDELVKKYFTSTLHAAGESVGIKWGEMGNSEVGHLTIGAGRIMFQIQPKIDRSIIDGSFFKNQALLGAIAKAKQGGGRLQLVGLLSDSGVHATIEHLYALLELAQKQKIDTFIHIILDGRDAPHNSGVRYLRQLKGKTESLGVGRVASLGGRFWGMDRDNNWERTAKAYRAIVQPGQVSGKLKDPLAALDNSYRQGIFDEQFEPASIVDEQGQARGTIAAGDAVIFYNFRPDRARQLTRAIVAKDFDKFERPALEQLHVATLAQYEETLPVAVAFPPDRVTHSLPDLVARAGLTQLHIAETEKYAHVTYFIGGGQEKPFPGEDRALVPSLGVASYETKPYMSAPEIREKVLLDLQAGKHGFYIVNFANADMVGHTGNLKAALQGIETIDTSIGEIVKATLAQNGVVFVTADHGNAEGMIKPHTGEIDKEHSAQPVPFIIAGAGYERTPALEEVPDLSALTPGGFLSDVAPTILKVMGLEQPKEMTGRSLI